MGKEVKTKKKLILKVVSVIVILLIGGAVATKAGYIDNYLDIEILCSEEEAFIPSYGVEEKPVIYLYPEQESDVKVVLDYNGELIADYPSYDPSIGGWNVKASPNGDLRDLRDNNEYSYIFWEGVPTEEIEWDLSTGFVVAGEDTREFLQEVLPKMGLTPREYNEFIVYWYPLMMNNKYNLIHFAGEQYTDTAPLTITPTPDSMLRVFMVVKPLEEKIEIEEQEIKTFERTGFSVIEWGGTEVK